MLVLSRKTGESLYITPEIKVTVVKIDGGKVRLGVDCPKDLEILREELCETVWGSVPIINQGETNGHGNDASN